MPDFGEIEVKAKRIKSNSMLTLATKSPSPKGINRKIFDHYKHYDGKDYCLHSTVYGSKPNSQSFRIVFQKDRLVLINDQNIYAYWELSIFDNFIKSKSNKTLLVYAETKGKRQAHDEKFWYCEAYLLSQISFKNFKSAVEKDQLKVDIRIGTYKSGKNKGKYHDHGTAFRINKKDFPYLFEKNIKIL